MPLLIRNGNLWNACSIFTKIENMDVSQCNIERSERNPLLLQKFDKRINYDTPIRHFPFRRVLPSTFGGEETNNIAFQFGGLDDAI